ncbi:hypothetical protein [Halobacterium litoreum]|uniref:Uncharacterized protein n=1 Tax=Halobacterium litoreum TaxID=2039234 RepID=A0ABD5NAM2_9EURY|nr:hypothetical protein [Halobacterium litoreum]UHH14829.1 hypothetical protein LT972_07440 [Halobacterium litoreum]
MPDSALADLLEPHGDDAGHDSQHAWVPGLPTLRAQQNELVNRLRSGFETREDVFLWTHAVAALSFGHVPDAWFFELLSDRFRVAALLDDQNTRERMATHPPNDSQADFVRDSIQQATLSEAFRASRADIRATAADFTDGEGGVGDPESQRFLGMRPRLHQIAVEQHRALRSAFTAFQSRRAVLDWVDHLDYATLGFLPAGFPSTVTNPSSDWWAVLRQSESSVWLQLRLAQTVLPAMNEALREAMETGTEEPDKLSEMEVPSG